MEENNTTKNQKYIIYIAILFSILIISIIVYFIIAGQDKIDPNKKGGNQGNITENQKKDKTLIDIINEENDKFEYDFSISANILRNTIQNDIEQNKAVTDVESYKLLLGLPEYILEDEKFSDLKKLKSMFYKKYQKDTDKAKRTKPIIENIEITKDMLNKSKYISFDVIIKDIYNSYNGDIEIYLMKDDTVYNQAYIIGNFNSFDIYTSRGISYNKIHISYNTSDGFIPDKLRIGYIGDDFHTDHSAVKPKYYNISLPGTK